jgi:hypothetical protein
MTPNGWGGLLMGPALLARDRVAQSTGSRHRREGAVPTWPAPCVRLLGIEGSSGGTPGMLLTVCSRSEPDIVAAGVLHSLPASAGRTRIGMHLRGKCGIGMRGFAPGRGPERGGQWPGGSVSLTDLIREPGCRGLWRCPRLSMRTTDRCSHCPQYAPQYPLGRSDEPSARSAGAGMGQEWSSAGGTPLPADAVGTLARVGPTGVEVGGDVSDGGTCRTSAMQYVCRDSRVRDRRGL